MCISLTRSASPYRYTHLLNLRYGDTVAAVRCVSDKNMAGVSYYKVENTMRSRAAPPTGGDRRRSPNPSLLFPQIYPNLTDSASILHSSYVLVGQNKEKVVGGR